MKKFNSIKGIFLALALVVMGLVLVYADVIEFAPTSGPALEVTTGPALEVLPDEVLPAKPVPDIVTTGPALEVLPEVDIDPPVTGPAIEVEVSTPGAIGFSSILAAFDDIPLDATVLDNGTIDEPYSNHVVIPAGVEVTLTSGGVLTGGVTVLGAVWPDYQHLYGGILSIENGGRVTGRIEVRGSVSAVVERRFVPSVGGEHILIINQIGSRLYGADDFIGYFNPTTAFVYSNPEFTTFIGSINQQTIAEAIEANPGNLIIDADMPELDDLTSQIHAVHGRIMINGGHATMESGVIWGESGNALISDSAMDIFGNGRFTMNGGLIRGAENNTGTYAVRINLGEFHMRNGRIVGPRAVGTAPAVRIYTDTSAFHMLGGRIDGDRTSERNYGTVAVCVQDGHFYMRAPNPADDGPIATPAAPIIAGYVTVTRPAVRLVDGEFLMSRGTILVGNLPGSLEPTGVLVGTLGNEDTSFTMSGGEIRGLRDVPGNVNNFSGTGVIVHGALNMMAPGGEIHTLRRGVCLRGFDGARFDFQAGTIRDNRNTTGANDTLSFGAGVNVDGDFSIFTMNINATIENNVAHVGAGVNIINGHFEMMSGVIGDRNAHKIRLENHSDAPILPEYQLPLNYLSDYDPGEIFDPLRNSPVTSTRLDENNNRLPLRGNRTTFNDGRWGDDGGGGVRVAGPSANFTMMSGHITGNTAGINSAGRHNQGGVGGGVIVLNGGSFTMSNGTISHNTANRRYNGPGFNTPRAGGGGVALIGSVNRRFADRGPDTSFTMTGGYIENNFARISGGGVALRSFPHEGGGFAYAYGSTNSHNDVWFDMNGGTIRGNTVDDGRRMRGLGSGGVGYYYGGAGVWLHGPYAEFRLRSGLIDRNHAIGLDNMGGGVFPLLYADFIMTGGTISNNIAGPSTLLPQTQLSTDERFPWSHRPGGFFRGSWDHIPTGGAFNGGGGIAARNQAWMIITGGTISGNRGVTGGGIYVDNWARLWVGHQAAINAPETALNTQHVEWTGNEHWHSNVVQWEEGTNRNINIPRNIELDYDTVAVRIRRNHAYGRQFTQGRGNDGRGGGGIALGDGPWPVNIIHSQRLHAAAFSTDHPVRGRGWRTALYTVAHILNGTAIYENTSDGDAGGIYWWSESGAQEARSERFISALRIDPGAYVAGNYSAQGTAMNDVWNDRHNLRIVSDFLNMPNRPHPALITRNAIANPAPWHLFDEALYELVTADTHPDLPVRYRGLDFTEARDIFPMPASAYNAPTTIASGPRAGPGRHSFNNHDIRTFGESAITRPPPTIPPRGEEPAEIELFVRGEDMGALTVELVFDTDGVTDGEGNAAAPIVPIVMREGMTRHGYRQVPVAGTTARLNISTADEQPDWFRVTDIDVYAVCRCMAIPIDTNPELGQRNSDVILWRPIRQDGSYVTVPEERIHPRFGDIRGFNIPDSEHTPIRAELFDNGTIGSRYTGLVNDQGQVFAHSGQPIRTLDHSSNLDNRSVDCPGFRTVTGEDALFEHEFAFPTLTFPYPKRPGALPGGTYRIIVIVTVEPRPFLDIAFNLHGEAMHFGHHTRESLEERLWYNEEGEPVSAPFDPEQRLIRLGEADGSTNPAAVGFTVFNGSRVSDWHVHVHAQDHLQNGTRNNVLSGRMRVPGVLNPDIHVEGGDGANATIFNYRSDWWITQPGALDDEGRLRPTPPYLLEPPERAQLLTDVTWQMLGLKNRDVRVSPTLTNFRNGEHRAQLVWTLVGEVPDV